MTIVQAPTIALLSGAAVHIPTNRFDQSVGFVLQNLSAVVPAKAGTHNHQVFCYRRLCHIASLRRMGPASAVAAPGPRSQDAS
jgi:hypothetical protein